MMASLSAQNSNIFMETNKARTGRNLESSSMANQTRTQPRRTETANTDSTFVTAVRPRGNREMTDFTIGPLKAYDMSQPEAKNAYETDMQIEEDFEKVKSAIKLETRNKIDQLFDAAEAGDNERYE
jgi:hypothetical protein